MNALSETLIPPAERDRLRPAADLSPIERARIYGVPASAVPPSQVRAETLAKVDPFFARVRAVAPDPRALRADRPAHAAPLLSEAAAIRASFDPRTVRRSPADPTLRPRHPAA